MRTLLCVVGGVSLLALNTGCRSHVAGRCDCTNHPQSAVITPATANYPVLGGQTTPAVVGTPAASAIAPQGIMGSTTTPAPMPSTLPDMPR